MATATEPLTATSLAGKLLSAMRYQFGGHLEKAAEKQAA